jgi:putative restriction endonuclease
MAGVPWEEDPEVEDEREIEARKDIDATTKEALVKARRGQGRFRADVLRLWGNCCAVTSSTIVEVIRASHIKPWRESTDKERLDPQNGFPLVANLDALFDANLITFEPTGEMVISPLLSSAERNIFGLQMQSLTKKPTPSMAEYLAVHRSRLRK